MVASGRERRKLRVVATPIGNLDDLSPRAAEALRGAAVVLAEDTRHSRPLLDRVGGHGKLVSCHQHNEEERVGLVVERLAAGDDVALITDAGAPSISDPGGRLVQAVVEAGFDVEVLPGPSALVAALMGAGIDATRFAFLGFLPKRGGARRAVVEGALHAGLALVVYEAPGRVEETLSDLAAICGPRRVVVARELTKRFETFHRGRLGEALQPPLVDKGEMVVVVEGGEPVAAARIDKGDVEAVAAAVSELRADESLSPRARAKRLAKEMGVSTKEAYALVSGAASAAGSRGAGPGAVVVGGEGARRAGIAEAVARARPHLEEVKALLARAAAALVEADREAGLALGAARPGAAAPPVGSDIAGADELLAWLDGGPASPAPVEARELGRALLGALSAADALEDALGFVDDG